MMKNKNLDSIGFTELNDSEIVAITGGDTGYYGKGPNLEVLVYRVGVVAHNVVNFFRGFFGL